MTEENHTLNIKGAISEIESAGAIGSSAFSQLESLFGAIIEKAGSDNDIVNLSQIGAYLAASNAETVDNFCCAALSHLKKEVE